MDNAYLKQLVIARLKTIPPNISFSVGSYGDFTRDELIRNVMEGTAVGKEFSRMEIRMIVESPVLVRRLSAKASASH